VSTKVAAHRWDVSVVVHVGNAGAVRRPGREDADLELARVTSQELATVLGLARSVARRRMGAFGSPAGRLGAARKASELAGGRRQEAGGRR
jgi:hypothetical protein